MDWLTDELLFYGGIMILIISVILLIIYTCITCVAYSRLKKRLKEEYGEIIRMK